MGRNALKIIALAISALVVALGAVSQMQAQSKTPYPSMAPLDQYLIADRNAEIALARSAAPPSISGDAKVLVLGAHGYETAVEGKNGFVCMVERAWMSPFDSPEFWNPKNRSPICLNPPAARTVLPSTDMRTKLILAGKSKDEIKESIKAAIEKKELPELEPAAMSYMMSKDAYLTDKGPSYVLHAARYGMGGKCGGLLKSCVGTVPGLSPLTGSKLPRQPGTDRYVPDGDWRVVGWNDGSDVGRCMERNAGCRARVFPRRSVKTGV
jgi:hypothetical protein